MQNFGKIQNEFNDLLAEGLVKENTVNKELFKKYIKLIKESDILKSQFLIYNNIENKVCDDSFTINLFVNENLKLLEKYKISDIIKENKKLYSLLESVKKDVSETYDVKLVNLHESLSKLIFTKKTPNNVEIITENLMSVINYIKENKTKVINEKIELPNSMLSTLMVDKYNERYSILSENEKEILKVLIESTDDEKKEVYNKNLKECIELINENLINSDLNTKEKLLQVKEKLLNDSGEINEDFYKNISRLVELKKSLQNND
jgi:hypothetical protein